MIDPKNIQPGVWVNRPDFTDGLLLILRVYDEGDVRYVTFRNWRGQYNDDCRVDWFSGQVNPTRRKRWVISKPTGLDDDDFTVICGSTTNGRSYFISAGCRFFTSLNDASDHWIDRDRPWESPERNRQMNKHRLRTIKNFRRALARRRAA